MSFTVNNYYWKEQSHLFTDNEDKSTWVHAQIKDTSIQEGMSAFQILLMSHYHKCCSSAAKNELVIDTVSLGALILHKKINTLTTSWS